MIRTIIVILSLCQLGICKQSPLKVVTSFSILGDFVKNIGKDLVEVQNIVPENADPHVYQPTPRDVALISKADLVIINGLDFEGWFKRLIENSGYKGKIITAGEKISARIIPGSKSDVKDPHAWHCVKNARLYIQVIASALRDELPDSKTKINENEKSYLQELEKLDIWVRDQYKEIPIDQRIVITTHDAFWYYGDSYGIKFLSPVGVSTDAEPSASTIAALITQIRTQNIRAVFIENLSGRKLIDEIAKEANTNVDGVLFADSLSSPGDNNSPARTYIDMIRHNTREIIKALR